MCLAVPGKVISIEGDTPFEKMGKVSFSGVLKDISLAYVPDVKVGNFVIVHVGFALNILDEAEAVEVFRELKALGEASKVGE